MTWSIDSDKIQEEQTDFSATVSKIKAAKPDAVFYAGYVAEAGPFLKQLRDGRHQRAVRRW